VAHRKNGCLVTNFSTMCVRVKCTQTWQFQRAKISLIQQNANASQKACFSTLQKITFLMILLIITKQPTANAEIIVKFSFRFDLNC